MIRVNSQDPANKAIDIDERMLAGLDSTNPDAVFPEPEVPGANVPQEPENTPANPPPGAGTPIPMGASAAETAVGTPAPQRVVDYVRRPANDPPLPQPILFLPRNVAANKDNKEQYLPHTKNVIFNVEQNKRERVVKITFPYTAHTQWDLDVIEAAFQTMPDLQSGIEQISDPAEFAYWQKRLRSSGVQLKEGPRTVQQHRVLPA